MITRINVLDVPEITAYSREEIEGGVIVRYLVRQPRDWEWTPVKLFVPTRSEPPSGEVLRDVRKTPAE